jgi:hypothetical protein
MVEAAQEANVHVWYIHPISGRKLAVLEDADRGLPLGCFEGRDMQEHHVAGDEGDC